MYVINMQPFLPLVTRKDTANQELGNGFKSLFCTGPGWPSSIYVLALEPKSVQASLLQRFSTISIFYLSLTLARYLGVQFWWNQPTGISSSSKLN